MDKVIVTVYIPLMDLKYDVKLPLNKKIYNIVKMLVKGVNEFSGGYYKPKKMPTLYNKETANSYDINLTIKEANIRNGDELILI